MSDVPRLSREEKKEQAYLEQLQRDAANFGSGAPYTRISEGAPIDSSAELDEIRRWEGSAAADEALRSRRADSSRGYTRISRDAPTQSAVPAAHVFYGVAPTNGFAIVSLVLGIIGGSILAIVFGHIALSQIERSGEQGSGIAKAGLTLGYISVAASIVIFIVVMFMRARP
ncbi:MAG: DUF4190 domain-containing protein [Pseudolysinimonas sp.]